MLALLGVITTIGLVILRGWCLKIMWGWFVVETFGVQELTTTAAIGIMLTIAMIQGYKEPISDDTKEDGSRIQLFVLSLLNHAGYMLVGLGIGWIVHQFI